MNLAIASLGLVATVIAAGAAVGAWSAARESSRAAAAMTAIETARWHTDLTPQFEVHCRTIGDDRAELRLALEGPPALENLDEVLVTIRDDILGRAPVAAGGPTAEQIAAHVSGPFRFVPRVDGADDNGRNVAPIAPPRGEWRPFALQRTQAPSWSGDPNWWQQYADQPVRLQVSCYRDGHKPWTIPIEVYPKAD